MERIVDLDAAAVEVQRRQAHWRATGLTADPLTWRDHAEPWPQRLRTDRSTVTDPDSLGFVVRGRSAELQVVLFRGGWADVDFFLGVDEAGAVGADSAGALPADGILSAPAFGAALDHWVAWVFGGSALPGERAAHPAADVDPGEFPP